MELFGKCILWACKIMIVVCLVAIGFAIKYADLKNGLIITLNLLVFVMNHINISNLMKY